jgi:hypothetical protein
MNVPIRRFHTHAVFLLLLAALFVGFSLTACAGGGDSTFASGTWRYKMTVTVSTPEGDKVGSAVREVSVQKGWSPLPEMHPHVSVKGEAVVVDLGKRGVVFALLKGYRLGADYGSDIPAYIFMSEHGWLSAAGIKKMSEMKTTAPVELQPENYPIFVRFKDQSDPKTVENLLDMKQCASPGTHRMNSMCIEKDHFEEAFGTGVRLKSVTIEMTKDPVTWGVEKWLPWLPDYYNKMFDGRRYNTIRSDYPFANSLASGAFKAGVEK